MNERLRYLDSMRGFAVVLMVQQHLQNWLWNIDWLSYGVTFPQHPYMLSFYFLGNFSAAMFLLVSGFGSVMLSDNNAYRSEFIKRGLFVLFCGYLLNVLTPHWFKPGTWYILHTMGIAIMFSPLMNKIKTAGLLLLFSILLIIPAFIQTWLKTPLMLGGDFMNNIHKAGGIMRLALAEGHFPLLPWLAFFVLGIICHRWTKQKRKKKIISLAVVLIFTGCLFAWFYFYGFFFATGGKFFRIFIYLPYIYPPLPSFMLIAAGIILILLVLFSLTENIKFKNSFYVLSSVGRLSLTWFFIHIIIFNEISALIGIRKMLNSTETFLIVITAIVVMIFSSVIWQKKNYKFSLEWLMRRVIKL